MKKNTILIAAAASILLIGCKKEQFSEPSTGKSTVVTVSIDNETKTVLGDLEEGTRPLYWTDGDQICINGITSEPLTDVEPGTTSAEFSFQGELSTPYKTFYPAGYMGQDQTTVTLPAEADSLLIPMAAEGLALKPLTGVLKITVNKGNNDAHIVSLQVRSTAQLSGKFTLDYAAGTLTGKDSSVISKTVNLKFTEAQYVTEGEPCTVFIPVPAGEYDFSVIVSDNEGKYMEKSTTSAKTVTAGKIMALTAFEYNPTGKKYTISSANDFVGFAQKTNQGQYDETDLFVLTDDITFDETSSKNLLDAGGAGASEDNPLKCTFDGQGHSIKGYKCYETKEETKATAADSIKLWSPLFKYTASGSCIRNLVIDSSCDIQLPNGEFGTLAACVKGTVENVICNADVNFKFLNDATVFGGLVGRVCGGCVRGCTMNGNIICNSTESTDNIWKIGGVAGSVEDGGRVENCTYAGFFQWGTADEGKGPSANSDYYFGGIAGHVMSGYVLNSNALAYSKVHDIRGKGGNPHIGGIAGCVEEGSLVSGCSNAQGWYVRLSSGFEAHIGGVVGTNYGTVSSCSYTSSVDGITGNVGHSTLALGGVVGKNSGEIVSCTSTGCIDGPKLYTKTSTAYMGGIVGWTTTSLHNLSHDGTVNITTSANWAAVKGIVRAVGGVVGYAEDEITLDKLTNNGKVTYKYTTKVNYAGAMVGGIIGYVNGSVTVSDCKNDGIVNNDLYNNIYDTILASANLGGIVGVAVGTDAKSATITGCVNNRNICCRRGIVGGICGWAKRSNITSCDVYGGTVGGEEGQLTENISAWQGGIVGKADTLAVISKCKVEDIKLCYKPFTSTCITGGIAGALLTSTSQITSCTVKNVAIEPQSSDHESDCFYGGVAGTSVEGSKITGCTFSATYGIKGSDPKPLTAMCSDINYLLKDGKIVLDCTNAANFRYDNGGKETALPTSIHGKDFVTGDFWLQGLKQYVFNGSVKNWGNTLNAGKNSKVKLPAIEGYVLTELEVTYSNASASRDYQVYDGNDTSLGKCSRSNSTTDVTKITVASSSNADRYFVCTNGEMCAKFTLTYEKIKEEGGNVDVDQENLDSYSEFEW